MKKILLVLTICLSSFALWGQVGGQKVTGWDQAVQMPDYVIEDVSGIIYARPGINTGYTAYSSTILDTVLNRCIRQLTSGGLIHIKKLGNDSVTSITVYNDNITIEGEGKFITKLKLKYQSDAGGKGGDLIFLQGADYFTLRNIELDGNDVNQLYIATPILGDIAACVGVMAYDTTDKGNSYNNYMTIDNCYIHDFTYDGVMLKYGTNGKVKDCIITNNGYGGVEFMGYTSYGVIENNYVAGSGNVEVDVWGQHLRVINNFIGPSTGINGTGNYHIGIGVEWSTTHGPTPSDITIDNNDIVGGDSTRVGIEILVKGKNITISNNRISELGETAHTDGYPDGIGIRTGHDTNSIIVNNTIWDDGDTYYAGISLNYSYQSKIIKNNIRDAKEYVVRLLNGSDQCIIEANELRCNTAYDYGIRINSGCDYNIVKNNKIYATPAGDYEIENNGSNNKLTGNYDLYENAFLDELFGDITVTTINQQTVPEGPGQLADTNYVKAVASKLDIVDSLAHIKSGLYYIEDYGAIPNDTANDYTANIQAATNAARGNGILVGRGDYKITSTVYIRGNADITGTWYVNDTTITAIVFVDSTSTVTNAKTVIFPTVYQKYALTDSIWHGNSIGISIVSARRCRFYISDVRYFHTGVKLSNYNNTGNAYNTIDFKAINYCKRGIHLSPTASGFVNDNRFYGGSILGLTDYTRLPGHVGILIDSSDVNHPVSNVFNDVTIEDICWQYNVECYGSYNAFNDCYWESSDYVTYPPTIRYGKDVSTGSYANHNMVNGGYMANRIYVSEYSSGQWNSVFAVGERSRLVGTPAVSLISMYNSTMALTINRKADINSRYDSLQYNYGFGVSYEGTYGKLYSDTYPRWQIRNANGNFRWSAGTTNYDTQLGRSAAKTLKIDSNLIVTDNITTGTLNQQTIPEGPGLLADTNYVKAVLDTTTLGATVTTSPDSMLVIHNGAIGVLVDSIPGFKTGYGDTTGFAPTRRGMFYFDMEEGKLYYGKGSARGDWVILNVLWLLLFIKIKRDE